MYKHFLAPISEHYQKEILLDNSEILLDCSTRPKSFSVGILTGVFFNT
jgi:hypothetical protein